MCNNARPIRDLARQETAAARWPHVENPFDPQMDERRLDILEQLLAEAAKQYARFRPDEPCPFRLYCASGGASVIARGQIVAPWTSAYREIHGYLGFLARGMRAVADATPEDRA